MYLARLFAFHDLAAINDFLSNTINHGRFFYITDYQLNQMSVHFTPTLLLLMPLYRLFASQFVFLVAGTAALFASTLVFLRMFDAIWGDTAAGRGVLRTLASLGFLAVASLNLYSRTVMVSAHYEIFYLLFAAATLYHALRGTRLFRLLPLALLAFGVREDAGIYFFFQGLSLFFLPRHAWLGERRAAMRNLAVLCLAALVYTAATLFIILPHLGTANAHLVQEFWGPFGNSPTEILYAMLTSPGRVLKEVSESACISLNATFGWLSVTNPVVFFLTNLPGVVFYISSSPPKKYLWYYNAAFLLPGMLIGLAAGIHQLQRVADFLVARSRHGTAALRALPAVVMLALAGATLANTTPTVNGQIDFKVYDTVDRSQLFASIETQLAKCQGIERVAADFRTIVFIPNYYQKVLLPNFASADAVFLPSDASLEFARAPSVGAIEAAVRSSGRFVLAQKDAKLAVYVRRDLTCRSG
jgi:uncharacterized membrane protein